MQSVVNFFLKYLYIPGAFLLSMGVMMGFVSDQWWPLPVVVIGLGILAICGWLGMLIHQKGWWQSIDRRMILQTLAVCGTLLVINTLIASYSWRWDLTENQLFTLSSQTQQIVKSLQKPLKVWVFSKDKTLANQELLDAYRRLNPKFEFEFAGSQSPAAQNLKVQVAGEVHLISGDRQQLLSTLNPGGNLSEVQLTAGIERLFASQVRLYWLQGHGEPDPQSFTSATKILRDRNYLVKPLVLAQTKIPQDAAVLAIIGSQKPLLLPEVAEIDRYLANGGRVLLLVDAKAQIGLDELLAKWGITLQNRLVHSQIGSEKALLGVVTDYSEHPITQSFGKNISLYPSARPLTWQKTAELEGESIFTTDANSWSAPPDSNRPDFDAKLDRRGPLTLGIAVKSAKSKAQLVVIGSAQFLQDGMFDRYINSDVFLNSLGWLSDRQTLALRPKEITNRRIDLSFWQTQLLFWIPVGLMPLASFTGAGWLWWRQR
jgi:ABC-type uncharacterized transport system involved in gliding motility auxiliary subunit